MLRPALVAAALLLSMSTPGAFAQEMADCTQDNMMKMESDVNAMTDATKKEMAMKEFDMAKDMMTQQKMDDCKMHLDMAKKAMQ